MTATMPDWKAADDVAVGKGATVQKFVATMGRDKLEIDVAPWGEGHLKVNGRQIAHVDDAKDRRQAFRDLKKIAERYIQGEAAGTNSKRTASMIPVAKAKLLEGKRGLIIGIANDQSIAWCQGVPCARGQLAVTYLKGRGQYVERWRSARV